MPRATVDSMAVLIDSSLWVHQLRKSGDPDKRSQVHALLENGQAVWDRAVRVAERGGAAGVTAPLADLLIFACAKEHKLDLAHDDGHFTQLEQLEA